MIDFTKITAFDWDDGNACKNDKHGVSMAEAEQPNQLIQFHSHLVFRLTSAQSGRS
jgi:uncharacterized DUF497 family protein